MPTGNLTDKQKQVLKFIESEILRKGYPPTVREIGDAVHLSSTSSVQAHMDTLEKLGYIRREPGNSRAVEILDEEIQQVRAASTDVVPIPVVGRVAAGQPILAQQNIEEYFSIPQSFMPNTTNDIFCLQVKGDSMINVGIFDKDLLIVEKQNTARNGDIVVCLIEDGATVKTFYKENGHYRLQPENDSMDPIIVDQVEVLGKVKALFRPSVF